MDSSGVGVERKYVFSSYSSRLGPPREIEIAVETEEKEVEKEVVEGHERSERVGG